MTADSMRARDGPIASRVRAVTDRAWRLWNVRGLDVVLHFGVSLGDNLLCSAVARELHVRGRRVGISTPHPELFLHNPHVARILPDDWRLALRPAGSRVPLLRPTYGRREHPDADCDTPPSGHLIADMCRSVGIRGPITLAPEVFLQAEERSRGCVAANQIAIVSSGAGAAFRMRNKEWPPERFQAVVDALRDRFTFVQLGTTADPVLEGAHDLRGRTSLRQAAAILAGSRLLVAIVGLSMHLARAVGTRSVIVYGGREHPAQSGYPCNENLYSGVPCAPCWRRNGCDYDRRCLAAVEPAHVIAAIERAVSRTPAPLETTEVVAAGPNSAP